MDYGVVGVTGFEASGVVWGKGLLVVVLGTWRLRR